MRVLRAVIWAVCVVAVLVVLPGVLILHPQTPLPRHWNPVKDLAVMDPLSPLTSWKLGRIGNHPEHCVERLDTAAQFEILDDFEVSDVCHIQTRLQVTELANVAMRRTETRCDTALVTAMWLQHGVQPAAQAAFGQRVKQIRTQGSYNCRTIGGSTRMSSHATASALDVAGFTLVDGTEIELLTDWDNPGAAGAFLRAARDSSCDWFDTTLGPDFNQAHADHFHLQLDGWGTCR
ncbi:MAG: extensin family protein [Pseudomonadota bacterium]